jgi:hypothetical protein
LALSSLTSCYSRPFTTEIYAKRERERALKAQKAA